MADQEARQHLRALERMGVRVVERPPEPMVHLLRMLAAICDPGFPDVAAQRAPIPREVIEALRAHCPLKGLVEWLESIGEAPATPAAFVGSVESWVALTRTVSDHHRSVQPAAQRCSVENCVRRAVADGYCMEHVRDTPPRPRRRRRNPGARIVLPPGLDRIP